jgi:hypothetical protein
MEWKPGTTEQGLINSLSVEFGITPYYKADKRFFYLSHSPENLDESVVSVQDRLGNATVNGEETYGTLRVFINDEVNVNGAPLRHYEEYSTTTAPSGWVFPSGYVPNVSGFAGYGDPGYIIWRDEEAKYTNVLEFLNYVPPTDSEIRVEYVYKDDGNVHQYYSDFSHPDNPLDTAFIGVSGTVPDPSSQIRILSPDDLSLDGASIGRRELAQRLRSLYGYTWNSFKWNEYTWENAGFVPSGSIPAHYDGSLENNYSEYLGGIGQEHDLQINPEFDILNTVWRPQVRSGTFFLGNIPFYLYEDKRTKTFEVNNSWVDISGSYLGAPITVTELTGLPATPSGVETNVARLHGYHPSGNQTSWAWRQLSDFSELSGVTGFAWNPQDQEFWLSTPAYDDIPFSGAAPTIPIRVNSPSGLGTNLDVSYEAAGISGVGSTIAVDLNPTNSYRYKNKFLVIDDEADLNPSGYLTLYSRSREAVGQNEIIRVGGHLDGPNGEPMNALVTIDVSGALGYVVNEAGTWQDSTKYTASDGTFRFDFLVEDIKEAEPYHIKVTSTSAISDSNYIDVNHPSGL